MTTSVLGNHLKTLRLTRQLTQAQVAHQLFVSRKTVSTWETGRHQPDLQTVCQLADASPIQSHQENLGATSHFSGTGACDHDCWPLGLCCATGNVIADRLCTRLFGRSLTKLVAAMVKAASLTWPMRFSGSCAVQSGVAKSIRHGVWVATCLHGNCDDITASLNRR